MDMQKVDMFIMSNAKYFEGYHIHEIRDRLIQIDDSRWPLISTAQFNDPTTSLIISIFAGGFGIDRFFIGDIGLGVAKLLTCGGLGVWTIVDWFLIQSATREKNAQKISVLLA